MHFQAYVSFTSQIRTFKKTQRKAFTFFKKMSVSGKSVHSFSTNKFM